MGCLHPALVVMAKQPIPGLAKTRLCPPFTIEVAAELAEAFLRDTVVRVKEAGLGEVLVAYTPESAGTWFGSTFPGLPRLVQRGEGLGERLIGVFEACAQAGYRTCIALGADSPDLPMAHLEEALLVLSAEPAGADVVLGPAEDGGYYLIGTQGCHRALFTGIDWSTDRVLAQTQERAASSGLRVHLLPIWYDIDTMGTLERLRKSLGKFPNSFCPASRTLLSRIREGKRDEESGNNV